MISTWSIAPEKAKKSNTSLSVACGDSPVTSIVYPPLLLMFSKLSSKLTKTTSYPSCFYYFQTWDDKKKIKQVENISSESTYTQL